jgi:hypothetical protein
VIASAITGAYANLAKISGDLGKICLATVNCKKSLFWADG